MQTLMYDYTRVKYIIIFINFGKIKKNNLSKTMSKTEGIWRTGGASTTKEFIYNTYFYQK